MNGGTAPTTASSRSTSASGARTRPFDGGRGGQHRHDCGRARPVTARAARPPPRRAARAADRRRISVGSIIGWREQPSGHIVNDAVIVGPEPQHVDGFGAEERHACGVGFSADPSQGEVLAQVSADLVEDVGHSAGGVGCSSGASACGAACSSARDGEVGAGVRVEDRQLGGVERQLHRLARCHLRLGGNPCHELVFADPRLGGQLGQLRGLSTRALGA